MNEPFSPVPFICSSPLPLLEMEPDWLFDYQDSMNRIFGDPFQQPEVQTTLHNLDTTRTAHSFEELEKIAFNRTLDNVKLTNENQEMRAELDQHRLTIRELNDKNSQLAKSRLDLEKNLTSKSYHDMDTIVKNYQQDMNNLANKYENQWFEAHDLHKQEMENWNKQCQRWTLGGMERTFEGYEERIVELYMEVDRKSEIIENLLRELRSYWWTPDQIRWQNHQPATNGE